MAPHITHRIILFETTVMLAKTAENLHSVCGLIPEINSVLEHLL
jgi:hypothetical protein